MAERLRCAVIGTGAIGLEHLKSFSHCHRGGAVAIAESNPARAREAGELYRVPRIYSDYRELLEQVDIDAVTIALPNHLHAPVALEAIKARKHVFLEKPMALNAKEAARIVDAAAKMRRTIMVGQNFRFNRQTQLAKMAVQRGDLGEVYHARCFWLRRSGIPRTGSWFTQKKLSGGGATLDIGVHMLDACLHLLGEFDVASVSGQTFAKFGNRGLGDGTWGKSEIDPKKPFDVDDYSVALLKMKSGRTVNFEVSWAAHQPTEGRDYGVDLLGTSAGLSLYPAKLFRNGPLGYETIQLSAPKVPLPEDRIQHFVNCVLDDKKPAVTVEESLKVQQVLDAIYTSAATGREVRLS
ncbi:Gfo/Idh/MocA family protein [Pedosphaera parvula]|uniref:Oxidoreductase domain protein n=1 Tax=Pedosphaera parvula (strain Ellin514) TaxID=320771 RepID=B9XKE7_PEDPL|nr:Gfo/Idh/MocA family oxidoreductase [Pedosphaera parvula]EEF59617.1 oxidoreductase domain protein [Pedosphaera parvula Ellin514]